VQNREVVNLHMLMLRQIQMLAGMICNADLGTGF
jgi:hypothetical protein